MSEPSLRRATAADAAAIAQLVEGAHQLLWIEWSVVVGGVL